MAHFDVSEPRASATFDVSITKHKRYESKTFEPPISESASGCSFGDAAHT